MVPTDKGDGPKKGAGKDDRDKGPTKKDVTKEPGEKNKGQGVKTPAKDTIDQDQIEEDYGLSYALFKAFPELDDLLKMAVAESWTPSKFQVELRQTKWFKKHSDVWREYTALQYSDPATFDERLNNSITKVQDLAMSVSAKLSDKALNRLAKRAVLFGLSDDELRNILSRHVKPTPGGQYGGELASVEQDLRSTAIKNGIRLTDEQVKGWMRQIVRGNASQDQYMTSIRKMAAAAFPLYGEQIQGGMDLADVASPYMQSMAEVLELNPAALTLEDPTIRTALGGTRDSGGKLNPLSIGEFEDRLRQDKRWGYTKKANESALGFASAIARSWGLV